MSEVSSNSEKPLGQIAVVADERGISDCCARRAFLQVTTPRRATGKIKQFNLAGESSGVRSKWHRGLCSNDRDGSNRSLKCGFEFR